MATKEKPYLVNGDPVTFVELIALANECGYEPFDGIHTTSEAAAFLRQTEGATVEINPE